VEKRSRTVRRGPGERGRVELEKKQQRMRITAPKPIHTIFHLNQQNFCKI
jgi:hypothetical protein